MNPAAKPILYSFRRCPYAMRARMALHVSGRACRLREIVLRDKPAAMLDASPKGTVPVLILDDGTVIDESRDIMIWALEQADPEGWLHPEQGSHEEMTALIDLFDTDFKHHLDRYKYASRYDGAVAETHRTAAAAQLTELDARLSGRPQLFGGQPSLADMALFPFIRQFANTDRAWFDVQPWPHLQAWLAAHLDSLRFREVMQKYAVWTPGGPEPDFPAPQRPRPA